MNQQSALIGSNTERWQGLDGAHHLHPFTNPKDLKQNAARIIESAQVGFVVTHECGEGRADTGQDTAKEADHYRTNHGPLMRNEFGQTWEIDAHFGRYVGTPGFLFRLHENF